MLITFHTKYRKSFKKSKKLFGDSNNVLIFVPRKIKKDMNTMFVNTYWWRPLQLRQS